MIKELMHDPIFLAGKSEVATKEDLHVAQDLLDTLMAHRESCVGMAANMIGVRKRIIAFLDYLFTQKGARRIYAYTEDYNVASQKLCEKLGMRREGFYLEFISFVNDENGNPIYENTYEYAILKKEWQ